MPLRRTILKLLLISLALAAVAGVLAVLLPTRDVMVKVMLTGLTTSLSALLMIGLSYLLPRPTTRLAGLYGMCAVVTAFVIWVALIWLEGWMSGNVAEQFAVTASLLLFASVPMLLYLMLFSRPTTFIAGAIGAASAAGAIILFNVATWLPGNPFWSNDEWWGTAWTVLGYGAIVAAPLIGAAYSPAHWWRWGAATVGVLATAVLIQIVWIGYTSGVSPLERWLCALTSISAVGGFINLALLPKLKGGQRWVRIGTIAAAVLTALFVNVIVLGDGVVDEDLFERFFAASAIVTGCGSLAIVVLMALNRRGAIEPSTAALLEVSLACPVCGTKQTVPVGSSECRKCGLKMKIDLEEPRCPQCDYLLLRMASDRCPECGALVRKRD